MKLDFSKGQGLIPVIIQEDETSEILMLGFMNQEAWLKTQHERVVWFYSRSRRRLWMKGETTGNTMHVRSAFVDCDRDTLLIRVTLTGVVCHMGTKSCFQDQVLYCVEQCSGGEMYD